LISYASIQKCNAGLAIGQDVADGLG